MTLFEYISVAVSLILSFGVAHLLARMYLVFQRSTRYWIHSAWTVITLVVFIAYWWSFWNWNAVTGWNFALFLLALGPPILLQLAAMIIVPYDANTIQSWKTHFYAVNRRVFSMVAGYVALIGVSTWIVLDVPITHPSRVLQVLFILVALTAASTKKHSVHAALLVLFVAGLIAVFGVILFNPEAPDILRAG